MAQEYFWFVFYKGQEGQGHQGAKLLLHANADGSPGPLPRGVSEPLPISGMIHRIGTFQGLPCAAYALDNEFDRGASPPAAPRVCDGQKPVCASRGSKELPAGWIAVDLRASHEILGFELYALAGRGAQLVHWDRQSRFCAACGTATQLASAISKVCPACGKEVFPVINSAILALVRKDNRILLARGRNFKMPFYSILAGFLEVGESLEECVAREVLEEVGLRVDNITYFGSQPWPFPSGLMVGFFADWRSGEIQIQEEELLEAAFYTRDALPLLPHSFSLSRRMIDAWVAEAAS